MDLKILQLFLLFIGLSVFAVDSADIKDANTNNIPPYTPPKKNFLEELSDLFIPHYERRNIIYKKESEHFLITVEDDESGRRHLVFNPNKGSQGIIYPDKPNEIVPNFLKYSFLAFPAMSKVPDRILFIGMGAGIMPHFIENHFPKCKIDIVEVDKAVPVIAAKYFGFKKSPNTRIIIEDGRFFVNRSHNKYDMIVVDAYNASEIPFQFTTQEFFLRISQMLNSGGVMVANIANFRKPKFTGGEFKTVASVFKHIAVAVCPHETNYVLFASNSAIFDHNAWHKRCVDFDSNHNWHFKLAPYIDTLLTPEKLKDMTSGAKIFRDDFAPVNSLD